MFLYSFSTPQKRNFDQFKKGDSSGDIHHGGRGGGGNNSGGRGGRGGRDGGRSLNSSMGRVDVIIDSLYQTKGLKDKVYSVLDPEDWQHRPSENTEFENFEEDIPGISSSDGLFTVRVNQFNVNVNNVIIFQYDVQIYKYKILAEQSLWDEGSRYKISIFYFI